MNNPLNVYKRFRRIIIDLKEKNQQLASDLKEACRAEAIYKESLIDEMRIRRETEDKLAYVSRQLDIERKRFREIEHSFRDRLYKAYNPQVK